VGPTNHNRCDGWKSRNRTARGTKAWYLAAVGLAVGIPVPLAVGTILRSMLYGLSSSDPLSILVAFAGIAIVTLAATFFQAHRAASIDPMRALRIE
jgi:ABC-type antimicrobial peptide transport system permease subunit